MVTLKGEVPIEKTITHVTITKRSKATIEKIVAALPSLHFNHFNLFYCFLRFNHFNLVLP